jgi:hypothetical protein
MSGTWRIAGRVSANDHHGQQIVVVVQAQLASEDVVSDAPISFKLPSAGQAIAGERMKSESAPQRPPLPSISDLLKSPPASWRDVHSEDQMAHNESQLTFRF